MVGDDDGLDLIFISNNRHPLPIICALNMRSHYYHLDTRNSNPAC